MGPMGFELLDIVEHYAAAKRRNAHFTPSVIATRNLTRVLVVGLPYNTWIHHGETPDPGRPILERLEVRIESIDETSVLVSTVRRVVFHPDGEEDEVVIPAGTAFRCEPRHIGADVT